MNKSKSIFVTALMALMLAAIIAGLYLLQKGAFAILAGLLALYGFICGAVNLCRWLERGAPTEPVEVLPITVETKVDSAGWDGGYEEIRAEVVGEA